jgi:hypothetical protein
MRSATPEAERRPRGVPWHELPAADVLERLATNPEGLTEAQASVRLARVGPNRMARTPPTPVHTLLARQFASVVVVLLAAAGLVAYVAGDRVAAAAIGAVLLINAALGFVVELRARRAMESLLHYEARSATVVRAKGRKQVAAPAPCPVAHSGAWPVNRADRCTCRSRSIGTGCGGRRSTWPTRSSMSCTSAALPAIPRPA